MVSGGIDYVWIHCLIEHSVFPDYILSVRIENIFYILTTLKC